MKATRSTVLSMRLSKHSRQRLKRMANRHGWTPSDASARLVEEGLDAENLPSSTSAIRRPAGKPTCKAARWQFGRSCCSSGATGGNVAAVAKHLRWPEAKVRAAINYAEVFPGEIAEAMAENDAADFHTLKRMLPQVREFVSSKRTRS